MNRLVSVMDVSTREIKIFKDVLSAAKFIGDTDESNLYYKLKRNNIKKAYFGYYVKYTTDDIDWPEQIFHHQKDKTFNPPIAVEITCVETGIVETYKSMNKLAERLKCERKLINHRIKKETPLLYKGYLIKYA